MPHTQCHSFATPRRCLVFLSTYQALYQVDFPHFLLHRLPHCATALGSKFGALPRLNNPHTSLQAPLVDQTIRPSFRSSLTSHNNSTITQARFKWQGSIEDASCRSRARLLVNDPRLSCGSEAQGLYLRLVLFPKRGRYRARPMRDLEDGVTGNGNSGSNERHRWRRHQSLVSCFLTASRFLLVSWRSPLQTALSSFLAPSRLYRRCISRLDAVD